MSEVQNTEVQTPEVDMNQAAETITTPQIPDSSVEAAQADTPPQYTPNFKFTAANKEHEIDEFIRPLIKDAETEKKIKSLYEKAYGLDLVKSHRDELKQKYQEVKSQFEPLQNDVMKAAQFIKNQDVMGLMDFLGVSKEMVYKAVKSELDYLQMSPEQRQYVDAQRQAQQRAYELEQGNMTLQQQVEQQQVEALSYQFEMTMGSPEVQQVASYYNSLPGKQQGDFEQAVLKHGSALHAMHGKLLSPMEVVKDFVSYIGYTPERSQQQSAAQTQSEPPKQTVVVKPEKPVITQVKSKPSTPVKSKIRSIDDIRKIQRQMAGG
jgi:hypothetical protein